MDPVDTMNLVISDETLGLLVIEQNDKDSTDGEGSNRETMLCQKSFSCKTCDEQFVEMVDYKNHICSHGVITEANNSCDRPVINKRSLKTRIKTHAAKKQLIKNCPMCDRDLEEHKINVGHFETDIEDEKPVVDQCIEQFPESVIQFSDQLMYDGNSKKRATKNTSDDHFTNTGPLTSTGRKAFSCDKCNKQFLRKSGLDQHMLCHSDESSFQCDLCCKQFRKKEALTAHMKIHSDRKVTYCDQCGQRFINVRTLEKHLETFHTGENTIASGQNNKLFAGKDESESENTIASGQNNKFFAAKDDSKSENTITSGQNNKLFAGKDDSESDNGEEPLSFNHGEEDLVDILENDNHIKSDKIICQICDGQFVDKTDLDLHMRIHIGEDWLVCIQCNERFTCERDLEEHKINLGHFENDIEDEKPVIDQYFEQFPENGIALTHSRIQTGEKLFACDQCNEKFNLAENLQEHMKIHTDEKPCVFQKFGDHVTLDEISKLSKINIGSKKHVTKNNINKNEVLKKNLGTCSDEKSFVLGHQKQLPGVEDMASRFSRIQPSENMFSCNLCRLQFTRVECLEEHLRYHGLSPAGKPIVVGQSRFQLMRNDRSAEHVTKNMSDNNFSNTGPLASTGEKAFACDQCNERFPNQDSLIRHNMLSHSLENPFQCEQCRKRFCRKNALVQHMKIHLNKKILECDHCGKCYLNVCSLRNHLEKFHTEENTVAPGQHNMLSAWEDNSNRENTIASGQDIMLSACRDNSNRENTIASGQDNMLSACRDNSNRQNTIASGQDNMLSACRDNSNSENTIVSGQDNMLSACRDNSNRENTIASGQDNMLSACRDNSNSENTIASGQDNIPSASEDDSNSENTIVSGQDNKLSSCKDSSESDNGEEQLSCNQCSLRFTNSDNLRRHMRSHSNGETFNCTKCSKQYTNEISFKRHLKLHQEKPSSCSICGKQFANINYARKHMTRLCIERSRLGFQAIPCDICGKQFANTYYMKKHQRIHLIEKLRGGGTVLCDQCGKNFENSSFLEKHLKTHSVQKLIGTDSTENKESNEGERKMCRKPFSCKKCDEQFDAVVEYENHVRSHDGVAEEYNCTICDRPFVNKLSLDAHTWEIHTVKQPTENRWKEYRHHMGIHSNEKLFICSVCGKKFKEKYKWMVHFRIHTGERPYVCNVCSKGFRDKKGLRIHTRIHNSLDEKETRSDDAVEKQLSCDQCNKCFIQVWELVEHVKGNHNPENKYKCDRCSMTFNRKHKFDVHYRTHTGEKPFVCNRCNKAFGLKSSLKHHMKLHLDEMPFQCSECDKQFRHKCNMNNHIINIHGGKLSAFVCKQCDKEFVRWREYRHHMRIHSNEFICSMCGMKFKYKESLSVHFRIHTGEKPYVCNVCNKGFRDKPCLKKHMSNHSDERPYICNICEKSFKQRAALWIHKRSHSDEKHHICSVCEKSFTRKNHLTSHMSIHTGIYPEDATDKCRKKRAQARPLPRTREKSLLCSVCSRQFYNSYSLKMHMMIHTGEKPYLCDVCSMQFARLSNLQEHMISQHAGKKSYQCSKCHKKFADDALLKRHIQTHTAENPFSCKVCNRKFRNNTGLEKHFLAHSNQSTVDQPAKCVECNKWLTSKTVLKTHMRIHTGEKPYRCKICNERFMYSSYLKNHAKTHIEESASSMEV